MVDPSGYPDPTGLLNHDLALKSDAEIEALAGRVEVLLETRTMPLPPGHRPIPWPAF